MSRYATAGDLFRAESNAEREIANHFADSEATRTGCRETTQALADQIAICGVMAWPADETLDRFAAQLLRDGALFTAQTIKLLELGSI
jgi:hypothetical protein